MKIGSFWLVLGIVCILGGALDPRLAASLILRFGAGVISGGINAITPNEKEQPQIIINVPQQNPERGYNPQ